ncbi:class I SAM-dependent methyltransferase [Kribbella sp. NPDC049174]|uniref:class I SAM-dependent methyltransferase n=1 Tax=Kribbella sp. NPDC049174 TaxID=3364112 RepID=UPI0037148734
MDDQKQWLAGVFDRAAPTYDAIGDAYHRHFARRLVELAGIVPGSDVLDVACGRGAVLLAAARGAGSLTGVDVSPGMIELAAADLRAAGLAGVDLQVMDAERMTFADASFDAVVAAFALFFLPDPERAAAEFRRLLRPGGVVAVSTWAEDDPRWAWEDDLIAAAGTPVRRAVQRPFDRAEDVVGLLTGAGFDDVGVHHEAITIRFASEKDWWDWHWSFSLRGVLEQFDPAALESLRTASYEQMAALRTADGFPLQLNAWIVTGRVSRGRRTASPPPSP